MSLDVQHDLRRDLFAALLRLNGRQRAGLYTGQVVSRAITDVTLIQMFLQLVPLVTAGPPGVTGFAGGRPRDTLGNGLERPLPGIVRMVRLQGRVTHLGAACAWIMVSGAVLPSRSTKATPLTTRETMPSLPPPIETQLAARECRPPQVPPS